MVESLSGVISVDVFRIPFLPTLWSEFLLKPTQADVNYIEGISAVLSKAHIPPMSDISPTEIKVFTLPPLDDGYNGKPPLQDNLENNRSCNIPSIDLLTVCSIGSLSRCDVSSEDPVTPDDDTVPT